MPNKPDPIDMLMAADDRIKRRRAFLEELASRTWKASELNEWRDELTRDPGNALIPLDAFEGALEKAKAEERYIDDVTPWFHNVRSWVPSDHWVMSVAEYGLAADLAGWLDEEKRKRAKWDWEKKQKTRPSFNIDMEPVEVPDGSMTVAAFKTHADALQRWVTDLRKFKDPRLPMGPISKEVHHGILAQKALPLWFAARVSLPTISSGPGQVTRYATEEELAYGFEDAQRARWKVWTDVRKVIFAAYMWGKELNVPWMPGFHWEPITKREGFKGVPYGKETRAAQAWVDENGKALLREVEADAKKAADERVRQTMASKGYSAEEVSRILRGAGVPKGR